MLVSQICKQEDFEKPWFQEAYVKLKQPFTFHRKLWEYSYIYQALLERGLLVRGKKGLGFGVGKEPLVALFASHGCTILATDLEISEAKTHSWVHTNQFAEDLGALNERLICEKSQFQKLVSCKALNMNDIRDEYFRKFDFTWSSCSFEHCGSIDLGLQFIINQMKYLKPGGVAVHTTEFNLSSNEETLESGPTVLFRRKDIEKLQTDLRLLGYTIDIDFTLGTKFIDNYIDIPPYCDEMHLRLLVSKYVTTSIGLIIERDGS